MVKGLGFGDASGALALLGSNQAFGLRSIIPESANASIQKTGTMKIVKVESIRFSDKINIGGGSVGDGRAEFYWVRIHTDIGIIGIGETYPSKYYQYPRDIDSIWKEIYKYQRMRSAGGSEMHILSAIDMALLDILGHYCEVKID